MAEKSTRKKNAIGVNFPKGTEHLKAEIEKRAEAIHMSASMYCLMILERFIRSGEAVMVGEGDGKKK